MADIREAMNTFNPALLLLQEKGYEVELLIHYPTEEELCETKDDSGEVVGWRAKSGKCIISAQNPVSLLGLVMVWEKWGDEWKTAPMPDLYMQIYERTFPEE